MKLTDIQANIYFICLSLITLPAVIYSYLKVVYNDDIHIYFGVARAASYFGSFPGNIDLAWETRPIGNRLVYYILYKICEPLYGNEYLFQIGTKAIIVVAVLLVSAYFAIHLHKHLKELNVYALFLLTSASLLAIHIMFIGETEYLTVILSIFVIALLLSDNKYAHGLAGGLLVLIVLMKLVTVFFIPILIAAWLLIEGGWYRPTKMRRVLFGLEIALLALVMAWALWFKNFVPDILLTLGLHDPSGIELTTRLYQMLIQSMAVLWFMPILIVGMIAGVLVFIDFIQHNTRFQQLLFIIMWTCPIISLFVQSEFFLYHYSALLIPCIISIILFVNKNYVKHQVIAFTMIILFTFIIFGATCSIWTDTHEHIWDNQISNTTIIKEKFNIGTEPVLYLDTGTTAYFLGAPSACRYTYPLVIRRGNALGLSNSTAYINAKKCIMNYNGEYLVALDGSIGDADIDNKIKTEYKKVYQGSAWSYKDTTGDIYQRV